ncbi:MAG: hypothetical protein EAZ14_08705 [Runella slithyformis]|jgi:hypothetical protein|nr:MAG: hypothetical protein EAZ80_12700 [Runella slithyformis]TAF93570.1 MAG: hypothetical protein EAZ46_11960 [Runella sp.]TAG16300.1 MAG: hypothetical protein EAZ38_18905 [Cytophagales bacterium]TAG35565.1 MAG: hypothetical protein EAZ32_18180 [Cytophagia bacterium]TAF79684.1 MAG: hypothetical protein EAZ50_10695 [Runella slithyformis]
MTHYKLDFSQRDPETANARNNRSLWGMNVAWAMGCLAFGLVFFGIVGTSFQQRVSHLSLRQEYDLLALKYDSLYATKLNTDKKIADLHRQIQQLRQTKASD